MATVLLAGAFGQRDPGDEAVLDAFLRTLPEERVIATSSEPLRTTSTHNCEAIRMNDPAAMCRALHAADKIVFAGGTIFGASHPSTGRRTHDLRRALLLATVARLTGKPVAMIGVGVGSLPDATARWLARVLIRRSNLLVLRDEESAHALAGVGAPTPLRVGADPAWTLVDGSPMPVESRDTVVVALSRHAGGADLADRLATALRPVVDAGGSVELQPWQKGARDGDEALAAAIVAQLGRRVEICAPPVDLNAARARMAGARLVVCLRFHAMIAAATAGTPLVALTHERKHVGLARRLGQLAVPAAAEPAEIAATILAGLSGQAASPASVRVEMVRAAEGLQLLRLLFTHGVASELDSFNSLSLEPAPWVAR
jgi:polysaccharide pyruvyl transferase WcaK-like protein